MLEKCRLCGVKTPVSSQIDIQELNILTKIENCGIQLEKNKLLPQTDPLHNPESQNLERSKSRKTQNPDKLKIPTNSKSRKLKIPTNSKSRLT
jgi:hypothetical protein